MKKIMITILAVFSVLLVYQTNADATENIIIPTVEIDGVKEFLYKEFINQEVELQNIKKKHAHVFTEIKNKFAMKEDISTFNWTQYRINMNKIYDRMDMREDLVEIRKFFDIFENKYQNEEIKRKIFLNDYSDLEYLLPWDSQYVAKRMGVPENLDNKKLVHLIKLNLCFLNRERLLYPI